MLSRTRRAVLGGAGAVSFATGLTQGTTNAFVLLDESFEEGEPDSFPDGWILRGNETQAIVRDDNAVGGENVLYMKGKAGGCLEATADNRLQLSGATKFTISLYVFPSTRGEAGCHDPRALIALWPDVDTDVGSILAAFRTDGTLFGHGQDLGRYQPDRWHKLEIVYDRTGSDIEVTYRLNGEQRGNVSWGRPDYESELKFLRLASGDFSTWWDEVRVVQMAGEEPTRTAQPAATGGDLSDLGLVGGGVGLGLYLLYRRIGGDENVDDKKTRVYDPDDE